MGILEELMSEIDSGETSQQVRELCDKVFDEEKKHVEHLTDLPKGPNILLALEVPGRTRDEMAFLSLDRELPKNYIIVLWTKRKKNIDGSLRKTETWEINESKANRILREYIRLVKFMKGE